MREGERIDGLHLRKACMKRIMEFFRSLTAVQKGYFSEFSREIAVRNLQLMRTAGYAGIILYVVYFVITQLFFKEKAISPLYGLIVPVLASFSLYATRALAQGKVNNLRAQRATLLHYFTLMLYIMIMSVFPHPEVPSAYYPLFLVMAPVLFILPAYQHLIMTLSSLALFFPLVLTFKSPGCWSHELFEATTASVFSVIVIVFMTQFRLQSESLKNKYYLLSRRDALTETANKAAGESAARDYIAGMRSEERGAMLLMDIDNFKSFNDGYGHLEGDRLLKMVGSALVAACRKDDIVYRFGGDEFAVLLKDIQADDVAIQKARCIMDAIANNGDGCKCPPTCSIGICLFNRGSTGSEELIRRADAALYHAKRDGRNRFVVWSSEMNVPKAFAAR